MTNSRRAFTTLGWTLTLSLLCLGLVACGEEADDDYSPDGPPTASVTVPDLSEPAHRGATVFGAKCAQCHGPNAQGTSEGPPLVHIIYEPGHHSDVSFLLAVRQGTRQHHWNFGAMDPVEGVSDQQVQDIVCYVRELQYANGIFSDPKALAACQT